MPEFKITGGKEKKNRKEDQMSRTKSNLCNKCPSGKLARLLRDIIWRTLIFLKTVYAIFIWHHVAHRYIFNQLEQNDLKKPSSLQLLSFYHHVVDRSRVEISDHSRKWWLWPYLVSVKLKAIVDNLPWIQDTYTISQVFQNNCSVSKFLIVFVVVLLTRIEEAWFKGFGRRGQKWNSWVLWVSLYQSDTFCIFILKMIQPWSVLVQEQHPLCLSLLDRITNALTSK